jgi:hypothetical protein
MKFFETNNIKSLVYYDCLGYWFNLKYIKIYIMHLFNIKHNKILIVFYL